MKTQTAITGGYLSKSMSVDTQVVTGDTYLKVNARIDWLLKAATGHTAKQIGRSIDRCSFFRLLREAQNKKLGISDDDIEEEDDKDDSQEPPNDLMSQLAFDDAPTPEVSGEPAHETPAKKKRKYKKTYTIKSGSKFEVSVPADPPEIDSSGAVQRKVRMYFERANQMWFHTTEVPWLVGFVHQQFALGGIALLPDEGTEEDASVVASTVVAEQEEPTVEAADDPADAPTPEVSGEPAHETPAVRAGPLPSVKVWWQCTTGAHTGRWVATRGPIELGSMCLADLTTDAATAILGEAFTAEDKATYATWKDVCYKFMIHKYNAGGPPSAND